MVSAGNTGHQYWVHPNAFPAVNGLYVSQVGPYNVLLPIQGQAITRNIVDSCQLYP